jgi:hypothetical protein
MNEMIWLALVLQNTCPWGHSQANAPFIVHYPRKTVVAADRVIRHVVVILYYYHHARTHKDYMLQFHLLQ